MARLIQGFSDTHATMCEPQFVECDGLPYYYIKNKKNFRDIFKNGLPLQPLVFLPKNSKTVPMSYVSNLDNKDSGDNSNYFEDSFDFENCENNLQNKNRNTKKHYSSKNSKKNKFFFKKKKHNISK